MQTIKPEPLLFRAQVIQIPSTIRTPIVTMFLGYVKANGLEWAINRFKSIKTDFIRTRGLMSISTPWIKHTGLRFCGPLGGLQKWAFKSDKNFDRSIQLLQLYTFYLSDSVTKAQEDKFVEAVEIKSVFHPFESAYSDLLLHAVTLVFPKRRYYPDPRSLIFRPISFTKNEPHASGKSYPEGEATLECAESFLTSTPFGKLACGKYATLFSCVLSGVASNLENTYNPLTGRFFHQPEADYVDNVGKIGLIQEPGFKLRAVANPARVYQQALSSLGDDLYGVLKELPWDCTHNQTLPFIHIQKHMGAGNVAHAIDLSNATDRFPFELQYRMLHHMYYRKDAIELFADLSRADWRTSLSNGIIRWTVGQPLGLYPSFASFALCHGLMLFALNGFKHDSMFYVLGDDVIILNDSLHSKYMAFLNNLDIPFAPSKTLSSNVITEFGGKLITPNRVMPQLKWREVSDDSFMDLARNVGMTIRRILRPRQRIIFDILKSIPDFLGGCGFNPDGKPLADRMAIYYNMLQTEDLHSYLLSYNGRVSCMNYEVKVAKPRPPSLFQRYTLDHASWYFTGINDLTFDQKVISLMQSIPLPPIVYSGFPWESLGSIVYNAFPRERYLQIDSKASFTTSLDHLERKLHIV